jgi:hypothetical protein
LIENKRVAIFRTARKGKAVRKSMKIKGIGGRK